LTQFGFSLTTEFQGHIPFGVCATKFSQILFNRIAVSKVHTTGYQTPKSVGPQDSLDHQFLFGTTSNVLVGDFRIVVPMHAILTSSQIHVSAFFFFLRFCSLVILKTYVGHPVVWNAVVESL
jgi:hypothetical protein